MAKDNKQRQYMALAPLTALAGIFIDPLASTVAPLILYFIFRGRRADVATTALRTADLAFSIQLWIVLCSLALMLGLSLNLVDTNQAKQIMGMATSTILVLFMFSLLFASYYAFKGKIFKHFISFKIAERVLNLVDKKKTAANKKQ